MDIKKPASKCILLRKNNQVDEYLANIFQITTYTKEDVIYIKEC